MKTPEASFLAWQRTFHNENDCVNHLKKLKWSGGFLYPQYAHGYCQLM